jgi:predicted secreted hydrolase
MKLIVYLFVIQWLLAALCACETESESKAATAAGASRLAGLLRGEPEAGYALAETARPFEFPADHGPHRAFRNEWWYLTGNLDDEAGRRYGYELTLFRFALAPLAAAADGQGSGWRSHEVFVGHFALTDVDAGRFYVSERLSRPALGLAGATGSPVRVWLEDWSLARREAGGDAEAADGVWLLRARQGDVAIDLSLVPLTRPVLNGIDGLSHKSEEPGNASYYYSVPRLETGGIVLVDGEARRVSGLSWLDREWSSRGLSESQQGWDWFALQLEDGSNLMFYQLRERDGSAHPMSAGTWMPARGVPQHLSRDEVMLEVRERWESPAGGSYPMAWTLAVPAEDLFLRVDPVLESQELHTGVRYWEGAVNVSGRRAGEPVSGRGYVELTGYAR